LSVASSTSAAFFCVLLLRALLTLRALNGNPALLRVAVEEDLELNVYVTRMFSHFLSKFKTCYRCFFYSHANVFDMYAVRAVGGPPRQGRSKLNMSNAPSFPSLSSVGGMTRGILSQAAAAASSAAANVTNAVTPQRVVFNKKARVQVKLTSKIELRSVREPIIKQSNRRAWTAKGCLQQRALQGSAHHRRQTQRLVSHLSFITTRGDDVSIVFGQLSFCSANTITHDIIQRTHVL